MQIYNVSFYQSKNNTSTTKITTGTTKDINTLLESIGNDTNKKIILPLRKLYKDDKDEYDKQKVFLDAITPSGNFVKRKASELIKHTGLLCIDIDNVENPTDIKDATSIDNFVYAAFVSPSGAGVKILIKINPKKHLESFEALKIYYESFFGIVIDEQCKDVCRLCFVSYDEDIFINPLAEVYKLPLQAIEDKTKQQIYYELETITKRIEAQKIDITNGYKHWLNLGFALAEATGENGRALFHRLSIFNTGYNDAEADLQFTECLKSRKKGVTINSFFWLCKNHNINIKVDKGQAQAKPFLKNDEVEISDLERIEKAINEKYNIRLNSITECIEVKDLEDLENENFVTTNTSNIWRQMQYKRVKGANVATIKNLLESDFVSRYNPYIDYFNTLEEYNKKTMPDYIQNLSDMVILKDEEKDRIRFNTQFKKALVRCVACSVWNKGMNNLNFNKHCIVLINPHHSVGKSSFIRYLVPQQLEAYYSEKIPFGSPREEDFTMQSSFIINLDEMASIKPENLQVVKTALSKSSINVRRMGTQTRLQDARRCNYWGSTNDTEILKDDTGSVRWLCFEVKAFDKEKLFWEYGSTNFIDINNVWKQAFKLYNEGFNFQLSNTEIAENEKANEMYKEESTEEQLVKEYFVRGEAEKENFRTTTQIHLFISSKNTFLGNKLTLKKIGSSLTSLGFIKGQKYDNTTNYQVKGFYVKER